MVRPGKQWVTWAQKFFIFCSIFSSFFSLLPLLLLHLLLSLRPLMKMEKNKEKKELKCSLRLCRASAITRIKSLWTYLSVPSTEWRTHRHIHTLTRPLHIHRTESRTDCCEIGQVHDAIVNQNVSMPCRAVFVHQQKVRKKKKKQKQKAQQHEICSAEHFNVSLCKFAVQVLRFRRRWWWWCTVYTRYGHTPILHRIPLAPFRSHCKWGFNESNFRVHI